MVVGFVHRTIYTNLLSGCLLPLSAAVSRCSVTECLNGSACCEPQTKIYLDYSWYGPLFICMLIIFSVLCLCGICNKGCCSRSQSSPPSPRETPLTDMGPPPPYSEDSQLVFATGIPCDTLIPSERSELLDKRGIRGGHSQTFSVSPKYIVSTTLQQCYTRLPIVIVMGGSELREGHWTLSELLCAHALEVCRV